MPSFMSYALKRLKVLSPSEKKKMGLFPLASNLLALGLLTARRSAKDGVLV